MSHATVLLRSFFLVDYFGINHTTERGMEAPVPPNPTRLFGTVPLLLFPDPRKGVWRSFLGFWGTRLVFFGPWVSPTTCFPVLVAGWIAVWGWKARTP